MPPGPRDVVGTLAPAIIGVVSLIFCGLVVLLSDDDLDADIGALGVDPSSLDGAPAAPGSGSGSDGSGSDGSGPSAEQTPEGGSAGGALTTPAPTECTKTECPALGPPTEPPGAFPFPPGAQPVSYAEDFCQDLETPGSTVREVPGSLDEVRDYYLANLLDAGYGWGVGILSANPLTTNTSGRTVPVGWDGPLTTRDNGAGGNLSLEAQVGPRTACGPGTGVVYITVETP